MSNVIVVGCGRVGTQLANMLSDHGDNVCVIDSDPEHFRDLGRNFNGSVLEGAGYDLNVLRRAGVEDCDVVAAVTNLDNTNLMIAEVASHIFQVPHVIVRLYNPYNERTYMQLGIDYSCGTTLVAEEMYAKIIVGHSGHIETFGEFEILRFSLNLENEEKRTIRVSELERDHDIRIVAFERADGSASSIPTRDSILYQGDAVIACVRHDLIDSFSHFMLQD